MQQYLTVLLQVHADLAENYRRYRLRTWYSNCIRWSKRNYYNRKGDTKVIGVVSDKPAY